MARTKEEIREYQRKYREAHREKAREYNRAYYARNAEEIKAVEAAKRAAPKTEEEKAKLREASRRRMQKMRERRPDCAANEWAKQNPERVLALQRRWCKEHPEHAVAKAAVRRARAITNGGKLTRKDVAALKESADGICAYCLRPAKLQVEHCTPLARGGANDLSNRVMACWECNRAKDTMTPLEFMLDFGRR